MNSARNHGHILVVDDEGMVREVLARYLESAGFRVTALGDGNLVMPAVEASRPDLILLDVMLPGTDGITLLQLLRRAVDTPVILLTARDDEVDRIAGLEIGADDYITKPFSPREVVARVRTVLRRAAPREPAAAVLDFGSLTIEVGTREVVHDGVSIDLTKLEFDLLVFLASSPRQVFSRAQLLRDVWDSSEEWQDPSTVTTHIRRLRKKLELDPNAPRWIQTAWGVGYRFEP